MARDGCTSGVLFEELLDGSYDCVDRVVPPRLLPVRTARGWIPGLVADLERLRRGAGQHAPDEGGWSLCATGEGMGEEPGSPHRLQQVGGQVVHLPGRRRAVALYVDEEFTIAGRETETGVLEFWATHPERGVAMSATAETAP